MPKLSFDNGISYQIKKKRKIKRREPGASKDKAIKLKSLDFTPL